MMLRNAVTKGGQLVLEPPLPFPDGTQVKVRVESAEDDPLLLLANNAIETGVPDLAEQHDHYTYGTPKTPK